LLDVEILNKQSEELGVLRQTLLFTGLEVVAHNINRRQTDLKLFEFGKVYAKDLNKYSEKFLLSIWATGNYESDNWNNKNRPLEFHDFYSVILKIINKFIGERYSSETFRDEVFRHGLLIKIENHNLAKLGQLNEKTLNLAGLKQDTFYCEIDFEWLISNAHSFFKFQEISKYPEVRRDLSLVIDKGVSFEEIKEITKDRSIGGVLKKLNVFDYYEGDKLDKGKKAYAITFILQDENKTLTDKAIDKIMARLTNLFENKLGAIIRK
jgi:phenylalanyl-tRNA synthetase beta chain